MFKILTKNGIENTNIDGARANRLLTGGKSGVVSDALNENTLFTLTNNSITVNTCELIIAGHRIVLTSPETVSVSNTPASQQVLSLVAQLDVTADSVPSFSLILQSASAPLVTDNLFKTITGAGRYQIELAQVTQLTTGSLTNLVRTVKTIEGGGGAGGDITIEGGAYITVGEVTVTTIQGDTPTVNIENTVDNEGNPKTDFHFGFPELGSGGSSVEVVQTKGSSTMSVMSQKATSEELYKRVTTVNWDSDGRLNFTYETAGGGLRTITYTPPSGGGSTTLYQHFVCCDIGLQGTLFFTIFNTDPTPFNSSTIWNHMPSEVGKAIPVSGYYDTGVAFKIAYEEEYQDSYMTMIYYTSSSGGYSVSGLYDLGTVTDTVTEMK